MIPEGDLRTDPIARSAALRQEADVVLREIGLRDILSPYGRIVPSGSYVLDIMMYPDIDFYISKLPVVELFEIGSQLARCELVYQVVFEKSRVAGLPGGLYLKPRIDYGDWGRPWKVDIWSVDDIVIDEKMEDMLRFRAAMTGDLREQILRYKYSILTNEHRTPMYSGYFVCKAFLDEGLTDFRDVTQYLLDNGIRID
jgi:hypothetical protein